MLREIFGDTNTEDPLPQTTPNTTRVFRLAAAMPEFAAEVSALLVEQGETVLAESVADLWVFDRGRCGAEYCATIYSLEPNGKYTGGLSLLPKAGGAIYIDNG